MRLPARPNSPKYAKAHFTWIALGSMLAIQAGMGILVPKLLFSGHNTPTFLLTIVGLMLMVSSVIPVYLRGRWLRCRLRETDCHLCPDCGYDLRDHADADPFPRVRAPVEPS